MDRTILHCDCNSFYASVETLLDPSLADGPSAVCGDPESRHGIILAKNEQAKKYGVKTAETIWQAKRKCPELRLVAPHREEYVKFSRRCNELYLQYTDLVDPFGIDESFLDVTGSLHLFGTGAEIADELRRRMRQEIGLTISVGVSFNRAFAKLGSDYKKPDGTTVFSRENYRETVWPLPADTLLYVGKRAMDRLERLGVRTIGDLAACEPALMHSVFGKMGDTLLRYARGEDDERVHSFYEEREVKSVGNSMTFAHNLVGEDECRMGLTALCDNVGRRLRGRGLMCQTVQLIIRDPDFKNRSRQTTLERPTNSTRALIEASMALLRANWTQGRPVRLLSVTATGLLPETQACEQLSLFDAAGAAASREKQHQLDQTVDELRRRFGDRSVVFAHSVRKTEGKNEKTKKMP
ncbi:MAG: DNA polymerase IV [Eubacteriales bacterium]|nr:DNA polymerase IV [Eubacteriales bacterium]